jgi:hypothetical protein
MTTPKPHIKLNNQRQTEGQFTFRYIPRGNSSTEDEKEESLPKDYTRMAQQFRTSLIRLRRDKFIRTERRDPLLIIPVHIDYIRIQFQSQFNSIDYFSQYINSFGLEAVSFSKLGTEGLFAVIDQNKVRSFIISLENFIKQTLENIQGQVYDSKIKYIKDFELLSTDSLLAGSDSIETITLRLVNFPLSSSYFTQIWPSLEKYLIDNKLNYSYGPESHSLEVEQLTKQQLTLIVDNFDVVLSVTSNLSTVIGPSKVAIPKRSYGFTISQPVDNLPIVGIIDTGISNQTPLADVLINDSSFDITGTGAFVDNANHGTGVAALVALGKRPYAKNYRGEIDPDAQLLSIKVMDSAREHLKPSDVLGVLNNVKAEYPEIKIFVLTIGNDINKKNDEDFSVYVAELDKFSYKNDVIIFISTTNNHKAADDNSDYDIGYFNSEVANLSSPAESMNNVTVGACSDNITGNIGWAISESNDYPALYTRKHHINIRPYYPKNKNNKHYFKPDIIESGGDYEKTAFFIAQGSRASIEILSADPSESFFKQIGTSYSAPLAANLAVRIQKLYPQVRAQTIKALIINSANKNLINFPENHKSLQNRVIGHGIAVPEKSLYSNENSITFILEDEITIDKMQLYPIHLPKYLYDGTLSKNFGILRVTATMCFSFLPYTSNQLSYCPVHIGFSMFRNTSSIRIIENLDESKLRESWTQDSYHKAKPIPYSNSQKISFVVGKKDLIQEDGTFKIAVSCRLNPQILQGQDNIYRIPHRFSLVLCIEENLKDTNASGRLYNEMVAINHVENISVADIELEGTI